jgi:predicted DNA-binding transcriptional regulator YafY
VLPASNGPCKYNTEACDEEPVILRLHIRNSMGADVRILEPEDLKEIVKKEVAKMAKVLREK